MEIGNKITMKIFVLGVIFDFDGVLINTDVCHYYAWKTISEKLNIYFDEDINNQLRGVSRKESLQIILRRGNICLSEQEQDELLEEKNRLYCELVCQLDFTNRVKYICSVIDELHSKKIKIAVASSSKNARNILRSMGILERFDAVIDGNDISACKPDKEVFVKASDAIGIEARKCLVVEDSWSGIEAAQRAGMKCICVKGMNCKVPSIKDISEIIDIVYNKEL